MEDASVIEDQFLNDDPSSGLFCIFDGHGGREAAVYAGKYLHQNMKKELERDVSYSVYTMEQRLECAYLQTDIGCCQTVNNSSCGSTGLTCLLQNKILTCANVGDSRAILCQANQAIRLSTDHKAESPLEAERITKAGGIMHKQRVFGTLAVTRSFGDASMKEFVLAKPAISQTILNHESQFMILACDGLWDVASDEEAVDMVLRTMKKDDQADVAQVLVHEALARGSSDNLTVIVVFF